MNKKEYFMRRAIELALRGEGKTSPNPMVGAVIVKDGHIIGEGFHEKAGGPHAERNALRSVLERAKQQLAGEPLAAESLAGKLPAGAESLAEKQLAGAELYVTLEPCCHYGKTPPCTEAILASGISRVIVGSDDPNPQVAGGGIKQLREAGIEVERGFLREECDRINPVFFHYIRHKTPYVAMKYAMTADGKTATVTGASKWITGEQARAHVQILRNRYAAIMAGIGTVLADDPLLTCRLPHGRQPLRVICDSLLRIPAESRICQTAAEVPTVIAALRPQDVPLARRTEYERKCALLEEMGLTVLFLRPVRGQESWDEAQSARRPEPDLTELMQRLGERGVDSVLLEGGAELNSSALRQGLVNKIYVYIAPRIFGGAAAKGPVGGYGVPEPGQAYPFRLTETSRFGGDILLEYEAADPATVSGETVRTAAGEHETAGLAAAELKS